jgi:wyosine [tRNA(Phe)-imidazoG37] synthetase (radical SAM superfamily)
VVAPSTPRHRTRRGGMTAIAFGPVPSRRLGRSLGINNIPPKSCSYACVYCQVGRTSDLTVRRRRFHDPAEIVRAVEDRVREVRAKGGAIDYLAFVPDGEPTLDANLGQEIEALGPLGIPVAVLSNGSLLHHEDVQSDLLRADFVSLKVDAVEEDVWRRVNRPHGELRLDDVLRGRLRFSRRFAGTLATETLLVAGVNDDEAHLTDLGRYVQALGPDRAYLAVPIRPPAEEWVRSPGEDVVLRAFHSLAARLPDTRVELLVEDEGDAFASTGDARADLLAITAVHPMREEAVDRLLARTGQGWPLVDALVAEGRLSRRAHHGATFFVRRFTRRSRQARGGAGERRIS